MRFTALLAIFGRVNPGDTFWTKCSSERCKILNAVLGRTLTEIRHTGTYGDRCPEEVRDANGNYPDYCDDMLLPNGDCLFDDVMVSKADCYKELGPEQYEKRVSRQRENEAKRRQINH